MLLLALSIVQRYTHKMSKITVNPNKRLNTQAGFQKFLFPAFLLASKLERITKKVRRQEITPRMNAFT